MDRLHNHPSLDQHNSPTVPPVHRFCDLLPGVASGAEDYLPIAPPHPSWGPEQYDTEVVGSPRSFPPSQRQLPERANNNPSSTEMQQRQNPDRNTQRKSNHVRFDEDESTQRGERRVYRPPWGSYNASPNNGHSSGTSVLRKPVSQPNSPFSQRERSGWTRWEEASQDVLHRDMQVSRAPEAHSSRSNLPSSSSGPRNMPKHLRNSYQAARPQSRPTVAQSNHGRGDRPAAQRARTSPPRRNDAKTFELAADSSFAQSRQPRPLSLNLLSDTLADRSKSFPIGSSNTTASPNRTSPNRRFTDPPTYLTRIGPQLIEDHEPAMRASRQTIFEDLTPNSSSLLPSNRVALVGPLGAGKTFIAIAYVQRLSKQIGNTAVFWICAESHTELQKCCAAIARILGYEDPRPEERPWQSIWRLLMEYSTHAASPWLAVFDDVQGADRAALLNASLTGDLGKHAYVLFTTRHIGLANDLLGAENLRLDVGPLEPSYAGDILGRTADAAVFDEIGLHLGHDAFAVTQARAFLDRTNINPDDYAVQLDRVLDGSNWAQSGIATRSSIGLFDRSRQSGTQPMRGTSIVSMPDVLQSCLNPSWSSLFDQLHNDYQTASELLSVLSVLGRRDIPMVILSRAADIIAANELVNQSILTANGDHWKAGPLMLIAHRAWLAGRNALQPAHKAALHMVAIGYPDDSRTARQQCEAMEPFVMSIWSDAAQSWLDGDDTTRICKVLLYKKTAEYFRLSGKNTLLRREMQQATANELKALQLFYNDPAPGRGVGF